MAKKEKTLVTGWCGFIGGYLLKELADTPLLLLDGDIRDYKNVKKQLQGNKVTKVLHLASIIDTNDPQIWDVNVGGTINLMNALQETQNDVQKFIFYSSVREYSKSKEIINEGFNTIFRFVPCNIERT